MSHRTFFAISAGAAFLAAGTVVTLPAYAGDNDHSAAQRIQQLQQKVNNSPAFQQLQKATNGQQHTNKTFDNDNSHQSVDTVVHKSSGTTVNTSSGTATSNGGGG